MKPARQRKASAMQRIRERMIEKRIILESRLLMVATGAVAIAFITWTIAISTDYWFHVGPPGGQDSIYLNRTGSYFLKSHSGLWTICKSLKNNGSEIRMCHNHKLLPSDDFIKKNPEVNRTILDYTRTEMVFAIISCTLIVMGFAANIYTFRQSRYMFKRLAGALHIISAACVLIVIEVVVNSVHYEEQNLVDRHPYGAVWWYGFSFVLAWFTFVLLVSSGIVFIICSRKRKDQASGDEPNIIGRT